MKKFCKILIFILVTLVLLSVLLVVLIGISISDDSDNSDPAITASTEKLDALLCACLYDSLEDVATTEEMALKLTEVQTNYILNAVRRELKIPFLTIRSLYSIYNDDSSVSVEAPISFLGFKSVIRANLDIQIDFKGTLTALLKDIKIGKLGTDNLWIKNFLLNNLNEEELASNLQKEGLFLSLSIEDGIIKANMEKEDMENTIRSLVHNGTEDLFAAIVDELLGNESILKFRFNDENIIGLSIYLHTLLCQQTLKYDLESGTSSITTIKSKVKTLLKNGVCSTENATLIFDYLVRGYSNLGEESQKQIRDMDFTSIGIPHVESYSGIIERSNLTMLKIFLDAAMVDPLSLVSILTSGHFDISITESNLNELLNTLPFMGTSFAFVHEEDVANITIASLFADVEDNKMTVYMVLDVNGVHCECSVNASTIQNTGAIVTLKIDSVQLGTQEITNVAQEGILRYLENVLNVDFISVNAKEDTLSLDFSNYLEDSFFHNLISSGLSKVSVVLKSTYEGEIAIRLSK